MEQKIKLNNGLKMPLISLGTWMKGYFPTSTDEELRIVVNQALESGYRSFDLAYMNKNEHVVGEVIKSWINLGKLTRSDVFLITKLPMVGMTKEKVEHFCKLSCKNLDLEYIDLYLVQVPFGLKYIDDEQMIPFTEAGEFAYDFETSLEDVWQGMEYQVNAGRVKSIGICNYNSSQIKRILDFAKIKPAVLQIELNAYFQQKPLRTLCKEHNINVMSFGSLGSPGRHVSCCTNKDVLTLISDETVLEIGKYYKKTPAQILLRFLIQQGIPVTPKSVNPEHIISNIQLFDFSLNPEHMKLLESLDKGESGRSVDMSVLFFGLEKHLENPMKLPW